MATHIFTAPSNGMLYKSDLSTTVQPGDTIILRGQYTSIFMKNIFGTALNPVNIIVENEMIIPGNGNYGVIITGSHWNLYAENKLKIIGATLLNQSFGFEGSSNIVIDGVYIEYTKVGFFGNSLTSPTTGTRENIRISNCTIKNVQSGLAEGLGTCEGIYIGNTSPNSLATSWNNVVLENLVLEDLDGDGIQLALAQNSIIRNCTITNYARKNINSQKFGILVGGCSQALVENCNVSNGRGGALHIYGVNKTIVRNCNFTATSTGAYSDDAVYIEKKCSGEAATLSVEFDNVVINGANRNGVRNVNAVDVLLKDVIISNTASSATNGSNFRVVNAPPPVFQTTIPATQEYTQFQILNGVQLFSFTNAGTGIQSITSNLPAGLTLNYTSGTNGIVTISGTLLQVGSQTVEINITTSNGNSTLTYTMNVMEVPPVEKIPVFVIYDNGTWESNGPIKTLFTNVQ